MSIYSKTLMIAALIAGFSWASQAEATDRYIGDVVPVGFKFCPRGTIPANGAMLSISDNTALFSLYGAYYGGDGRTTFGVPDLRGRLPVGVGPGPGLTERKIGAKFGTETVTLTEDNIPTHTHKMRIQTNNGKAANANDPLSNGFGDSSTDKFRSGATLNKRFLKPNSVVAEPSGNATPEAQNNIMPTQSILYCVVTKGIYPPKN